MTALTESTMATEPEPTCKGRLCRHLRQQHGNVSWTYNTGKTYAFRYGIPSELRGTLLSEGFIVGIDSLSVRVLMHEISSDTDDFLFLCSIIDKNGIKHSAARDTPPIYVDHVSIDTLEKLISPTEAGSVLPDILRLHIGFSFLAGDRSVEFYGALFDACAVLEEMTNAN
jgi:hypothetical protein